MRIMKTKSTKIFKQALLVVWTALMLGTSACKKNVEPAAENPNAVNTKPANKLRVNAVTYNLPANSNSAAFQTLVNNAAAGDIIILMTGSHYVTTPITLPVGKNNITIRGQAGAVIRKAPNSFNASAIEIKGNYNIIDLVELDGGNLPEAGIIIYGQHNTVSNSKIHNCGSSAAQGAGILLHNLGNPVCAFNTVIGCSVYYNYMVGISQNGHSDGTIRDNVVYQNGAEGITVDILSHNNYIYNNTVDKNNTANRGVGGIGIDYSNGNRLDNNTVSNTYYKSGIIFQNNIGGCDGTIVSNNHLNNNAQYGILQRVTQFGNTNTAFINNTYSGNTLGTTHVQN